MHLFNYLFVMQKYHFLQLSTFLILLLEINYLKFKKTLCKNLGIIRIAFLAENLLKVLMNNWTAAEC